MNAMRVLILSLFLCCAACGDAVTNTSPTSFETAAELDKWAKSAFGGAWKKELAYKKQKLVVYFRSHTSGVSTSEPNVFVERGGRWVRLLTAMT
jgi:hypothetical protein